MKKNLFRSFGLLAVLCACSTNQQQPGSYVVTGELPDSSSHGKTIYIMRYDDGKRLDSTKVEGKTFTFTGKIDTASYCRVDITRREFANFVLENGEIRLKPGRETYNLSSGTPQNDEIAKLSVEEDSIYRLIDQKREELQKQYPDPEEFETQIKAYVGELKKKLNDRCMELYKVHHNDAVGFYLLYSVFMNESDVDVQEKAIASFGPWLKSRKTVQKITSRMEAQKKTAEGQPFVDIKGKGMDGKPAALSDYVGKGNYVLMDIWASWCGPCKGEIPNLAKIHNKYKDKGLTVLGLFVWDKEENLGKAVKEEKVTWPQIMDSEETATRLYGVDGIPHIILFAPDGTIAKRGLRGENMIATIDEIMTKK